MPEQNIDDVIKAKKMALMSLDNAITMLEIHRRDPGVDQQSLDMKLPTLHADSEDLRSDLMALVANRTIFAPPSAAVFTSLTTATTALSNAVAQDQAVALVLNLAIALGSAASSARN